MRLVEEEGMGTLEVFALSTEEDELRALLTELFTEHWQEIRFGTLIQGAVFEIAAPNAPDAPTWSLRMAVCGLHSRPNKKSKYGTT